MNNKASQSYLNKSNENFKLYEFLSTQDDEHCFMDWQAVSIFYSTLCYVKAYLFSKPNIPESTINSHVSIKSWLTKESTAKRLMIYEHYYSFLYNCARDARYKCKKTTKQKITLMLEKHNEIKRLLVI